MLGLQGNAGSGAGSKIASECASARWRLLDGTQCSGKIWSHNQLTVPQSMVNSHASRPLLHTYQLLFPCVHSFTLLRSVDICDQRLRTVLSVFGLGLATAYQDLQKVGATY